MSAVIAPGITLESDCLADKFKGSVPALLAAGIIEQKHLIPQPGRLSGITMFLPDGQPVPVGWIAPTGVPGYLSVRVLQSGKCVVRKTVPSDEHQRRIDALPPYVHETDRQRIYRGTMEKLLALGVPATWMEGLPKPGKSRGSRNFGDGDEKVEVSVGQRGVFRVFVWRPHNADLTAKPPARTTGQHQIRSLNAAPTVVISGPSRNLPAGWRVIEGQRPA